MPTHRSAPCGRSSGGRNCRTGNPTVAPCDRSTRSQCNWSSDGTGHSRHRTDGRGRCAAADESRWTTAAPFCRANRWRSSGRAARNGCPTRETDGLCRRPRRSRCAVTTGEWWCPPSRTAASCGPARRRNGRWVHCGRVGCAMIQPCGRPSYAQARRLIPGGKSRK